MMLDETALLAQILTVDAVVASAVVFVVNHLLLLLLLLLVAVDGSF